MLTSAHADRGRPTLKDDEHFRNGLVRDLKLRVMNGLNAKLHVSMNAMNSFMKVKSERMNAKSTYINDQSYTYLKYRNTRFITNCIFIYTMHCVETAYLEIECRSSQIQIIVTKSSRNSDIKVNFMFLFIVSSSVCIIAWYMYLLWIVYSQILCERMLVSNNHVSIDNLHSFEKPNTPQLSVKCNVGNSEPHSESRSRYAKFIYQKSVLTVRHIRHVVRREREPSRIPAKKLSSLFKKSRKLRKLVRKYIKKNVPRSSRIHRFTYAFSHERKKLSSDRATFSPQLKKTKRLQVHSRRRRKQTAAPQTFVFHFKSSKKRCKSYTKSLDPNNSEAATYKNLNHRMNYCKFNLCRDIEKNPGPTFIDPSKTLHAPYSQGNVVFGQNAGQQCVAMSLCALIHNFRNKSVTHTKMLPRTPDSNYEHWQCIIKIVKAILFITNRITYNGHSAKHKLST